MIKRWMFVLLIGGAAMACSEPRESPVLDTLWTLGVGDVSRDGGYPPRIGKYQDSAFFGVHVGDVGNTLLGRVQLGSLIWTKEVVAGSMSVSDTGRVHFVASGIQRIEPSGNELSGLFAGLTSPPYLNLVTAYENAAIAVQVDVNDNNRIQVVRVSAANTVDWTQSIELAGRCLKAHVVESAQDLIIVAGSEGAIAAGCGFGAGENVWAAALSPLDGRVLWSQVSPDALTQDVTVVEDVAITADGHVFIGGTFGLKALRADGTEIWYREETSPWGSFSAIEPLAENALAMAEGSRVYLVDATDGTEQDDGITVESLQDAKMAFDGDETVYVVGQRALVSDPAFVEHAVTALHWSPPSP